MCQTYVTGNTKAKAAITGTGVAACSECSPSSHQDGSTLCPLQYTPPQSAHCMIATGSGMRVPKACSECSLPGHHDSSTLCPPQYTTPQNTHCMSTQALACVLILYALNAHLLPVAVHHPVMPIKRQRKALTEDRHSIKEWSQVHGVGGACMSWLGCWLRCMRSAQLRLQVHVHTHGSPAFKLQQGHCLLLVKLRGLAGDQAHGITADGLQVLI